MFSLRIFSSTSAASSSLRAAVRPSLSLLQARMFASHAGLSAEEVTERVSKVVKNFEKVDAAKVTPAAHFQNDLGLDSLDAVEVVMALEDEFAIEIPDADAEKIQSLADAIKYVSAHPQAK